MDSPETSSDALVRIEAVAIAREIVAGEIDALAGAARIWALSSENDRACFDELLSFISAASQWDDSESTANRDALARDAADAARELVARYPQI